MNELLRGQLHASIDGELSEQEQQELEQQLSADPEARRYYQQLQKLDHILSSVPSLQMPDGLHGQIVNQIKLPRPSRLASWLGGGIMPGLLRYGLAATAGVVMTLVVVDSARLTTPDDLSGMAGTMSRDALQSLYQPLDSFRFDQPGARGEVTVGRRGGIYIIEVELDSDGPLDLDLAFSEQGPGLGAFARKSGSLGQLQYAPGGFTISSEGPASFEVLLNAQQQPIAPGTRLALEISQQGRVIESAWLEPGW
jgi:hypothetical protein